MERAYDRGDTDSGVSERNVADVETAGETTAAATGSAEIGAATGETKDESSAPPVGADTMVKVAGDSDSTEEGD